MTSFKSNIYRRRAFKSETMVTKKQDTVIEFQKVVLCCHDNNCRFVLDKRNSIWFVFPFLILIFSCLYEVCLLLLVFRVDNDEFKNLYCLP